MHHATLMSRFDLEPSSGFAGSAAPRWFFLSRIGKYEVIQIQYQIYVTGGSTAQAMPGPVHLSCWFQGSFFDHSDV